MFASLLNEKSELKRNIDALHAGRNTIFFNGNLADKAFIINLTYGKRVLLAGSVSEAAEMVRILKNMGERVEVLFSAQVNENSGVLLNLAKGTFDVLVLSPAALVRTLPSPRSFLQSIIHLKEKQNCSHTELLEQLVKSGYMRINSALSHGTFSVRGDIIDVFAVGASLPVRIDFFGNTIESIKSFETETYKTVEQLTEINIAPLQLAGVCDKHIADYLPDGAYIFYDNPKKLAAEFVVEKAENAFLDKKFIFAAFTSIYSSTSFFESDNLYEIISASHVSGGGNMNTVLNDLGHYRTGGYTVALCLDNKNMAENYLDIFKANRLPVYVCKKEADIKAGEINLITSKNTAHIIMPGEKIAILSLNKLTPRQKGIMAKEAAPLPKVGDFVVHAIHGVGRCEGIQKLKLTSSEKDYIVIAYERGDKLFLPCENADFITKYSGGEISPKLNILGGTDFEKVKNRVKASVKELAFNLVELYKTRENSKGFAFLEDDALQKEFEEDFPYTETDAQTAAIKDVKADMQSDRIMDRLICGDVGYGKTEVAFRAAFKAVLSGKQVAFLAPTTILSTQHYHNARARMAKFGVNICLLNRFKSKKEQKQTLEDLACGKCNIVFGTHRLLSHDVKFFDLGLLVLDEEQRFGVNHKEKIKNIKRNIDVLAMSATPIPRTLHMSMIQIRDISIIDTPPEGRMAVLTYVNEYNTLLVKNALQRELNRGGQSLVVHNRIDSIFTFAQNLSVILDDKEVVIDVAHAQMPAQILEDKIMKVYAGETDILVATTLIENGIDLPNANTLIVTDSDRMGLSQLYQLKGRVGRSDRLAYAYFTYDGDKVISEDSMKRLEAINQFTTLGSGYKIAMRDLEIRGAGNLLGAEQHGHMQKVGYDLYVEILASAVAEAQGDTIQSRRAREVVVDVSLPAVIPEQYIPESEGRIKVYKDFAHIENEQTLKEAILALTEAYGKPPREVENLAYVVYLKHMGAACGVKKISIHTKETALTFYKDSFNMSIGLTNFCANFAVKTVLKMANEPIIAFETTEPDAFVRIRLVLQFLKGVSKLF